MKRILVFGILVLIFAGFVLAQEKDTLKVPDRLDSLETGIEKVKTDLYNRSITHINIVAGLIGVVVLIIGALGTYTVIRTGRRERELKEDLKEMRSELREDMKDMRSRVVHECQRVEKLSDQIRDESEKAGKSRVEIETIKSMAEKTVGDMESKYKEMENLVDEAKSVLEDTTRQKEASEEAAKRAEGERLFAEAFSLQQRKKLWQAIDKYSEVTELLPDLADTYYNWGTALSDLADFKKYEPLYRESFEKFALAIKYKQDYHEAYNNWGYALNGLGKLRIEKRFYIEALSKLEKGIEIKKDDPDIWYNKACAHSLLEEKNDTLESLKRAIELDSKYKKMAKEDEDFKWLWEDEDFKKLVE